MLRRPLHARIEVVNAVYDEVHGNVRRPPNRPVGAASTSSTGPSGRWTGCTPPSWGTVLLARGYADLLAAAGLEFEPPALEPEGGQPVGWRQDVSWMVREGAPWVGRRARDLGPWAVRMAWEETRPRRTPVA